LCECSSNDQSKCSKMCINFQHGKKIVSETGIEACTKECAKKGVPKDPVEKKETLGRFFSMV